MGREGLVLGGTPPVTVALRRNARARRMSLRVSRVDGRVTLTAPPHVPLRELRGFLADRTTWVRDALAQQPPLVTVGIGTRLPVLGEAVTLVPGRVRAARREGSELVVTPERAAAQAEKFLRGVALARLTERCDAACAVLGRSYDRIALRDTRGRWGSCSSAGRLMFSWRLAMAPARILDYVAAHEAAHLVEMNHSAAFWAVTARLHPAWEADRAWLRQHGAWMHRYRFGEDT